MIALSLSLTEALALRMLRRISPSADDASSESSVSETTAASISRSSAESASSSPAYSSSSGYVIGCVFRKHVPFDLPDAPQCGSDFQKALFAHNRRPFGMKNVTGNFGIPADGKAPFDAGNQNGFV
jgi:hypothetical protein